MPHLLANPAFEAAFAALRVDTRGEGRPVLILHGGGGPRTVGGLTQALASEARVIAPTHPGFDGTSRPEVLGSIPNLAAFYVQMMQNLDLDRVLVVGSSIGGWIASGMALLQDNRIAGLVLIDAVGIAVEGEDVADVFTLSPMEMMDRVFHAPDRIRSAAPVPTNAQKANDAANLESLAIYDDRKGMQDPTLQKRLSGINVPVLVLWGKSDQVARVAYGKAYAAAIKGAKFQVIAEAGHLPQIEQPAKTTDLIRAFRSKIETQS